MADIIVSQQHKEAVETHQRIITSANLAQQNLWDMCQGLKKMRDDKLYKEFGYQNFETYCENEVGMKRSNAYNYISIVEKINPENVQSIGQIGMTKLSLLATISEPEQAEIAEKLDLKNTTVKQLKAEIEKLKDDNLNLSMNYDRMDANRIKLGNENTELKIENKTLQKQVEELENRPVEVAVRELTADEKADIRKQITAEVRAEFDAELGKENTMSLADMQAEVEKSVREAQEKAKLELEEAVKAAQAKSKEKLKKLKEDEKQAVQKYKEAQDKIASLQKQVEIADPAKAKVLIYFEALKKDYNEMITAITELSAEDDKEKFTTAVYKMLQLLADNIR